MQTGKLIVDCPRIENLLPKSYFGPVFRSADLQNPSSSITVAFSLISQLIIIAYFHRQCVTSTILKVGS